MSITIAPFGTTRQGEPVSLYTLTNGSGMTVRLLDYACIIQSLIVPDRNGTPVDVVLGYDTIEAYEAGTCFFGAFVGRYANRIGKSSFTLNGQQVTLTPNEGRNHLHGVYAGSMFHTELNGNSVIFRRTSPNGEEGYPGKLEITVTCTLTEDNALILDYKAEADADTVVNLTNHSYFNLAGHTAPSAADHLLQISASRVTEVDSESIPTGVCFDVTGTPFDFRTAKPIGRDLDLTFPQLALTDGYDHNFVLDAPTLDKPFAVASCAASGITMECFTTQPGVQFYNANFVHQDPSIGKGKGGVTYERRGSFCLETQHFPDSPNQPAFPTTLVRRGETSHEVTIYQFKAE